MFETYPNKKKILQLAKVVMAPKASFDNAFKEVCFGRYVLDSALRSLRERFPPLISMSQLTFLHLEIYSLSIRPSYGGGGRGRRERKA